MSDQSEKFNLHSMDLTEEKKQDLLRLFPEIRTEDGKIDFDRLKLVLGEMVEVGKERYGMNWPGKAECFRTIQTPSTGTLLPCPEESVKFDTTENLIIEGDNLEVLKLLQKAYLGKVKLIYIDPPYNTGNDFIYPDNYTESMETYLEYTGQVDCEGRKFGTNTDTDGRFHSRWMNLMYPRLYLAKNLLRDDGLIFISIDDVEMLRLHYLCDEIFGEENFIATLIWKKSYGGGAKTKHVVGLHEYVIVYSRNKESLGIIELPPDADALKYYKYKDEKLKIRGPYRTQPLATTSMDERPNLRFPITWQNQEIWPEKQWQWSSERVKKALAANELVFSKRSDKWVVDYKQYLRDEDGQERGAKPFTLIEGPYTQIGTKELRDLNLDNSGFVFPKPVGLIEELINYCGNDAIVLDFFAGSGTTAQAVLELNNQDGGKRKFILVQLPEPCAETSEADKPGFLTIADITKERVRRAIIKINETEAGKLAFDAPQDRGFRVFKLAESNFTPWNAQIPQDAAALVKQLELHIEHIREGRSQNDILYELLLKSGFPLTTPIQTLKVSETFRVFSVAGGALLICLDSELTLEVIRAIAAQKPERVICLDAGFAGNDQLKANAVQIFKTQGVPSFKTV
jgi:adenine-specific DNA-methyltransferase